MWLDLNRAVERSKEVKDIVCGRGNQLVEYLAHDIPMNDEDVLTQTVMDNLR